MKMSMWNTQCQWWRWQSWWSIWLPQLCRKAASEKDIAMENVAKTRTRLALWLRPQWCNEDKPKKNQLSIVNKNVMMITLMMITLMIRLWAVPSRGQMVQNKEREYGWSLMKTVSTRHQGVASASDNNGMSKKVQILEETKPNKVAISSKGQMSQMLRGTYDDKLMGTWLQPGPNY